MQHPRDSGAASSFGSCTAVERGPGLHMEMERNMLCTLVEVVNVEEEEEEVKLARKIHFPPKTVSSSGLGLAKDEGRTGKVSQFADRANGD